MSNHLENITLRIWRQAGPDAKGHFEEHKIDRITDEMFDRLPEGWDQGRYQARPAAPGLSATAPRIAVGQ